jgi:hypothetical protein
VRLIQRSEKSIGKIALGLGICTLQDQTQALEVAAIHAESRGRYGSPRVHAELAFAVPFS